MAKQIVGAETATVAGEPVDYKQVFKAAERTRFQGLVSRKMAADLAKKEADRVLEEVKEEILVLMLQAGEDRMELWDGYRIKVVRGRTAAKVDARLLLERGVKASVIEECTIAGSPTEYVQIDLPKGAKR